MEKLKRVVCSSSFFGVSLLSVILPLVFFSFLQIDQWKVPFTIWDNNLGSGNLLQDVDQENETLAFLLRKLVRGQQREQFKLTGFAFLYESHSDLYVSSRNVRFDANASKVYVDSKQEFPKYTVQPYPRKDDAVFMKLVKPVEIQHGNVNPPACDHIHDAPAIVFSSGVLGNMFHEFNDLILPLFITSRHFRSHVKFVVTDLPDYNLWFISKYKKVFSELSRYEVINAAETGNGSIHCFPGAVVGLKYHGFMTLNNSDTPGGYSMFEFRDFLRKSYGLKIKDISQLLLPQTQSEKPRLLLLPRTTTRKILNQDEVVKTMEGLGFRVVIPTIREMSDLDDFAQVINSCSVVVGVHGAGLTNGLFLPGGGVMIEVVPIGLDWAANACYGAPAEYMDLQYLEYKIQPQESSLYDLYGPDHPVIVNPESIKAQGYPAFRALYLVEQNVKINLQRFRETLVQAMRLLGRSI